MAKYILLVFTLISLTGCSGFIIGLFPPYGMHDFGTAPDGKRYFKDTSRNRRFMKSDIIDDAISDELSGEQPPPRGNPPNIEIRSWNDVWVRLICYLKHDGKWENSEQYVNYTIEQRRKVGLPEIIFPTHCTHGKSLEENP